MKVDPPNLIIVYDDREFTNADIQPFVGDRRYSDIIFRRRKLRNYFLSYIQNVEVLSFHHLSNKHDLIALRDAIEQTDGSVSLFVASARAGIVQPDNFSQLLARLPYAEDSFSDRVFKPLVVYYHNCHELLNKWEQFKQQPIQEWQDNFEPFERLSSVHFLDLGISRDFLYFMSGSTESRHFNAMKIDNYYYTKSSSDKRKMEAEYRFYSLVPEKMRPWLIQPFDFQQSGDSASYKMMRYYLADSALQWVHGAFTQASFQDFIDRLMFFVQERPKKEVDKSVVQQHVDELFLNKVEKRIQQLLEMEAGVKVNQMVALADPALELNTQFARYKQLLQKHMKHFQLDYLSVGHGDPCFSNVLYDQQRYLLKVIDPKGALEEEGIWTHPFYDLCKISHSILGNYDFINNGLYEVCLDDDNRTYLKIKADTHLGMKQQFRQKLKECGYNWRIIRLAEASLFLSMLPLHIDHPNKIMAFVLTAKMILDEVESE